ncbi:MAG: glycosyltransferase family 39 protein [Candidatus Altiarchaeota archaeon]
MTYRATDWKMNTCELSFLVVFVDVALLLASYYIVIKRSFGGLIAEWIEEVDIGKYFTYVFLFGVALRLLTLNTATFSDEGMYIYMAKLINYGYRPYEDFFMSQTPIYHYLTAAVFRFFGVGMIQAKIIPVIFSILSMPIVYFATKRLYGSKPALLSMLLFVSSPGVVANTQTAVLYSELIFFSLAASYLFVEGVERESRWLLFLSGLSIGLAMFSRLFGAMLLPLVFIALILSRRKDMLRFFVPILLGFLLVFIPLFAFFYSTSFIYQVFIHHALFPSISFFEKLSIFFREVSPYYIVILVCGLFGFAKVLWSREKKTGEYYFFFYFLLSFAAFFMLKYLKWSNLFMYFSFASPAMAILSGRVMSSLKKEYVMIYIVILLNMTLIPQYVFVEQSLKIDSEINTLVEYTLENTNQGDVISGSGVIASYIAFKSNRTLPLDLVEYSSYRAYLKEPRQLNALSQHSNDIRYFYFAVNDTIEDPYLESLLNTSFEKELETESIDVYGREGI